MAIYLLVVMLQVMWKELRFYHLPRGWCCRLWCLCYLDMRGHLPTDNRFLFPSLSHLFLHSSFLLCRLSRDPLWSGGSFRNFFFNICMKCAIFRACSTSEGKWLSSVVAHAHSFFYLLDSLVEAILHFLHNILLYSLNLNQSIFYWLNQ